MDVWAGDIELPNKRTIQGIELVATHASEPILDHASLHFLACVDVARIPLYLAVAPPLEVYSHSVATQDWFSALLLSGHVAGKDTELPWWHASAAQSPIGILVEVRGAASNTNSPPITELLFYATSTEPVQDEALGPPSPTSSSSPPSNTLAIRALPISSDLLQNHVSSTTTPPLSPSRPAKPTPEDHADADTTDAEFHPPLHPSGSLIPVPQPSITNDRKRQSVSSLFDEAAERRKRARRHGGESVAAAAAGGGGGAGPPVLPNRRSASSSFSLPQDLLDSRPSSADGGKGGGGVGSRPPLSRSSSVSLSEDVRAAAAATTMVRRTSSLLRVTSVAAAAGEEGEGKQGIEARNKDVISRLVMAGMRMYGLQQRRKTAVRKASVASDNAAVAAAAQGEGAAADGDATRDEEYKLVYHQAYRGTVFAMVSLLSLFLWH
ncbi:hypothetical protein DBV05_g131 [Lasiodiplodia theobromae]|uniref:Sld7 C-terminal domain-containing protein n=1 Tax=Lasiodiplodia theobromae TaxID=45133 RepID=A0A5N5DUH0_9PEZI|nr:hypothetical protein DBV05_g131 [Lasiodiplodia theobromae]